MGASGPVPSPQTQRIGSASGAGTRGFGRLKRRHDRIDEFIRLGQPTRADRATGLPANPGLDHRESIGAQGRQVPLLAG
jgi:hypothetical protein